MDLAQARRHSVLCEFIRPYQSHEDIGGFDAKAMADRIVRLERILYALREPSETVVRAGHEAYVLKIGQIYADEGHVARHHQTLAIDSAIHAAVAAAEQEVGRE